MAEERTLGQLVAEVSEDLSELIRYEVALAKAEIRADLKRGGIAGALVGAAGYLVVLMTITLVIAAGYGLTAAGLSAWLAFLIIAAALLVLSLLLALVAYLLIRRIKPPERAIRSTKLTLAAIRGGRHGSDGHDGRDGTAGS